MSVEHITCPPVNTIEMLDFITGNSKYGNNSENGHHNFWNRKIKDEKISSIKWLVDSALNTKNPIEKIDGIKVSVSLSFSDICFHVIEPFLVQLIFHTMEKCECQRWLPTERSILKKHGKAESNHICDIYNLIISGHSLMSTYNAYKLMIVNIVDGFIMEWFSAAKIIGRDNPLYLTKEDDLSNVFETILQVEDVPKECAMDMAFIFQGCLNNWQNVYMSNIHKNLDNSLHINKEGILGYKYKIRDDEKLITKMEEEIKRRMKLIEETKNIIKKSKAALNNKVNVVAEQEMQVSMYRLASASKKMRDRVKSEVINFGSLSNDTMINLCQILAENVK